MQKSTTQVAVRYVIVVGGALAAAWLGIYLAFNTTNPFYVVSSGSMYPSLKINDMIVVRDGGSWDRLKVGDIIVFNRPDGEDRVIVHRVAEITDRPDGERIVRTKGDANPASIPGTDYPIREENYIGEVVYTVPGAGVVTNLIKPPVNYVIIAIILVVLFFGEMGKKKGTSAPPGQPSGQPPA